MIRVLIVDDDAHAAHALRRLLLRAGFSTEVDYSGEHALERLATFEAHIVITDFFMPGMPGAQLLTWIRHIAPSAIRVLMSASMSLGSAFTQDPTLAPDTIDFFFEKPWNDKKLVADLLRLHARGSPGGSEYEKPAESAPVEPKRYLSELKVGDRLQVTGGRFKGASVTVKSTSLPYVYCAFKLRGRSIEQYIPSRHLSVLDEAPSPPAVETPPQQDPPASLLGPQVLQSRLQMLREAVPDAKIELNEPATGAQLAKFALSGGSISRSKIALLSGSISRWVLVEAPSPPAVETPPQQDPPASLLEPQVLQSRLQMLREAVPDAKIELNEPATGAQLAEFESRLGLPVPETFRILYRTFNGCQYDANTSSRSQIYLGISLVPLEDILRLQQKWNHLEKDAFSQRFHPGEYWNAGWIPFLEMEDWGLGVIDTAGCFGGPPGQIIQFNYKVGAERDITYASFDAWLLLLIEQLERAPFFQKRHALPPRHRPPLSELAAHLNPGHPRSVVLRPVTPPPMPLDRP